MRGAYERALATLRESPSAPAGVLGMLVILYWAARDGGFDALVYLPSTLFLVGLVVVVAVAAPGALPGGRPGLVALVALAGFTAWSFLTILWADVPADAWSGANKTLAFFAVYALFALRPWRTVTASVVLGLYTVGIAAIGLNELIRIDRAADPGLAGFIAGRLAQPIAYSNANCALYVSAVIPALFFASRRETPVVLRAVMLAAAGVLVELAALCQSRASLLMVPLVALVYLALVPNRLRSILAMAIVGVVVLLSSRTLLDVYSAIVSGDDPQGAVDSARTAVFAGIVALLVAGFAWGLVDRSVVLPERAIRIARIAVVVIAVVAAVGAAGAFVQHYGDPVAQGRVWWDRFKANEYVEEADTPHFVSGFGSGRWELWRVATDVFLSHPIAGIGVDNFSVDFLRERRNDSDPLYPHSVALRTLSQTGLIGTALLLAFVIGVGAVIVGVMRRADNVTRGFVGTAVAVSAYWVLHGAIDWLWEIPALSAAAFAALGLAVGLSSAPVTSFPRRGVLTVAGLLAAGTLVTAIPPWLAARNTDEALSVWQADANVAYEHLDRARRLNPLSAEPDILAAVIAAQRGEVARQRAYFVRSLERDPYNWYARLEIAAIDARSGKRAAALRWLEGAHRLNPREWTIRYMDELVREGNPPKQAEVDGWFLRRAEWLTGVRQS